MNSGRFQRFKVLFVDDDPTARLLVLRMLEALDVGEVFLSEDGAQALELLKGTAADIDLVITDINMPNTDGWGLARRIRYGIVPGLKDVPILMLTGEDTKENAQKARIHRIDGFLLKPVGIDDLADMMGEALGA